MSIKIGNHAEAAAPTQAVGAASQKQAAPARPAEGVAPAIGQPESSTQVSLSSAAALNGAGSANGDFDAEKVARISEAIQNGTFKVNHEAIADKLIANAQEVLGKVAG